MPSSLSKILSRLACVSVVFVLFFSACAIEPPDTPHRRPVEIDITAPVVSILDVTATASSLSVTVAYSDSSGVGEVRLVVSDSGTPTVIARSLAGNPASGVEVFSFFAPPRTYSIHAEARDVRNNIGTSASTNAVVTTADTTRPVVTVVSPADGQSISGTVNLTVDISDDGLLSRFFHRTNNGNWIDISLSGRSTNVIIPISFSQDGDHFIHAYAVDGAANTSTTNTLRVRVDMTAPTVNILSPSHGTLTNRANILFSGTSSVPVGSISSVQVSLDGSSWIAATGTTTWTHTLTCVEGSNTVRVRAISDAERTNTAQILIIVDTTRPIANLASPTNGQVIFCSIVDAAGTASDTGSGIAETFLQLNSSLFTVVGTTPFATSYSNLTAGTHTLSVFTRDRAGNLSPTNSTSVTVIPPAMGAHGYVEFTDPQFNGTGRDIILQGFHWASTNGAWWNTVSANAGTIAAAGFTMVWLPPVSDAGDNNGYLPRRWYNISSRYGTPTQLSNVVSTLRAANIRVIADIVVNHRVGTTGWADFTEPAFPDNRAAVVTNDEWSAAHGGPGTGATDTGTNFHAGRDLDHTNPHVRAEIINWMRWLRQIGFDGWRYDYVIGFDATYVSNYNEATRPYFSVGEFWPNITGDYNASGTGVNYHRQILMNWIDRTGAGGRSTVFDFTTKWQLMRAIVRTEFWRLRDHEGRPIGAIGWWPAMSVTFIDNHDTGPSPGGGQNHWPFPQHAREVGYAYILTHPGIPSVYWFDYFDSGVYLRNQINTLMAIRRTQNIHSTSPITILRAVANEYVAMVNSNTIVKIGPSMAFNTNWPLAAWGTNWAVWTN